ncbi:hypothetical protein CERSUDRAFT_72093 [Gelatoporia subvermispora B]|uniref:Uncharacterized protein n=1 Tax=Ceriporiopsis subvermispora (strain B) TaxID=914234 RepID=M2QP22_CERS8|nr:hypothetical protein CERSUDRAFT_72093 [Gelatoporia subvermispora B]
MVATSDPQLAVPSSPSKPTSSTTSKSPSNSGSATIVGIAVMENPRVADNTKPRMVYFDASFYLGDNATPLVACLKYFNEHSYDFSTDSPQAVFLSAAITRMHNSAKVCSTVLETTDYDVIGDVNWLCIPEGVDPRQRPLMFVSGPVDKINTCDSQFDITVSQYVSHLEGLGDLSVRVHIPNSPRWPNSKPMPQDAGSNVYVQGTLSHLSRYSDPDSTIYNVTLSSINFFGGRKPALPSFDASQMMSPTRGKGRAGMFSFSDYDASRSPLANKSKKRHLDTGDDLKSN